MGYFVAPGPTQAKITSFFARFEAKTAGPNEKGLDESVDIILKKT